MNGNINDVVYWIHRIIARQRDPEAEYINDALAWIKERVDSYFPKRERRTPAVCPVTGEDVTHRLGLSLRAWQLIHKGLELEGIEARRAADQHEYLFSYFWLQYESLSSTEGRRWGIYPSMFDLINFLRAMDLPPAASVNLSTALKRGAVWLHEENQKTIHDNEVYSINLTEKQALAFSTWGDKLRYELQRATVDSFNAGQGWMIALAQGNVGIDQLNRLAAQQDKQKGDRDGEG